MSSDPPLRRGERSVPSPERQRSRTRPASPGPAPPSCGPCRGSGSRHRRWSRRDTHALLDQQIHALPDVSGEHQWVRCRRCKQGELSRGPLPGQAAIDVPRRSAGARPCNYNRPRRRAGRDRSVATMPLGDDQVLLALEERRSFARRGAWRSLLPGRCWACVPAPSSPFCARTARTDGSRTARTAR